MSFMFPCYWAHVRPLCLLWIAIHIRRRPRPYVYFTVRDIPFCRRFKPIDSYKRTSPRGPEAKHLRRRRTPINRVYAAGRLSSHCLFSQMYVRAAAERSLSGPPMHFLLVDAPDRAVPINGMFHARLEPWRAFVSSYPMDGILRNSAKWGRPINGILRDTRSAFTDLPRLCCRKHRSSQHHPCFRTMINLQPRILQPQCYRTRATSTPVDPTTNSKRHALLSAHVWPLSELLRSPFPFLLDFDLQQTFFHRPSSRVLFFGRLQHRSFLDDSNTVWPSGHFRHNLQIFLCWFIFVTSLQSSTDMVCYGSVLFSVSV